MPVVVVKSVYVVHLISSRYNLQAKRPGAFVVVDDDTENDDSGRDGEPEGHGDFVPSCAMWRWWGHDGSTCID